MGLTRRQALAGGAGAVAGAAGIYALVERHAGTPSRPAPAAALPPEQHLLDGVQVITDNGAEVLVPPLHHAVVTARVATDDLDRARGTLQDALADLESRYPATPAGLGITLRLGPAVLPAARARAVGAAAAGRRAGAAARAARRRQVHERPARRRARGERRRRPPPQRQPRRDRRRRRRRSSRTSTSSSGRRSAAGSPAVACRASSPSRPVCPGPT